MSQLTALFGPGVRDFFGPFLVGTAIASLREASANVRTPEQALSLAFDFRSCGIRIVPAQVPEEIIQLLNIISQKPPTRVLEIGTAGGGTFFLLARMAAEDALLISADLPQGQFGGGYPKWRGRLIESFARGQQRVRLLRADSHSPDTLRQIQELLNGKPLDFLLIDGDHRYEGVKADFQMYSPFVRPGGLI